MANSVNSISSFPYSKNRLLVIDWASLSYHQMFSLMSKIKDANATFHIDSSEKELDVWKSLMLDRIIRYVKLFNPMDIVFALEGDDLWRKKFYTEYYNKYASITYDKSGYYVKYDNFLYKLTKDLTGQIIVDKCDPALDISATLPVAREKVSSKVADILNELIPSYKGNRKSRPWEFYTDKKEWTIFRDRFARQLAPIFRGKCVSVSEAEGDDVIYVSTKYYQEKYESIILITRDSDMNQLLGQPNLEIFNHFDDTMVTCHNPSQYLGVKILAGDKSDNINGIALPGKKTQLGEAGATKLFESTGNCYALAQKQGWDNQYDRNRKLIDLSFIPTDVQRKTCVALEEASCELCTNAHIFELAFTDKMVNEINTLKTTGYYSVHEKHVVEKNPNIFKQTLITGTNLHKPAQQMFTASSVTVPW